MNSSSTRPLFTPLILLAFATVYLGWGSTYLAIRIAVETLPPFFLASARFLIAGAFLYAYARLRGAERPAWPHWRSTLIIGGLLLAIGNGGVVYAEQRVPSALTALLVATVPIFMAALQFMQSGREKPRPLALLGLVSGLAGVGLLVQPGAAPSGDAVAPLDAGILMMSAFSWAVGSLYSRKAELPRSPLLSVAMQMICGGALLAGASFLHGELGALDPASFSTRSLAAVAYLITVGSLAGFTAYAWLLRKVPPTYVSTYAYVNPVAAVFLGSVLGGETITPRTLVASSIIVGSVVLVLLPRRRAGSPAGR